MNIDQALIALCQKHGLASLSITAIAAPWHESGFFVTAGAQWEEGNVRHCRSSNEGTATEAIAHAIQQVNEARACVVEVPAMEIDGVAA